MRQLRYAVALAEHRHFTRAARALGVAQPPLSRQIAALEKELDAVLFDRTSHGVVPTAAGQLFCAHAVRVLGDLDAVAEQTRRVARGQNGVLRLGFVGSALTRALPALLTRLRSARPELHLDCRDMSSHQAVTALLADEVDVGVCRGAPRGTGAERLTTIALEHDRVVLLCPHTHPLASQHAVSWEQVQGQPLVVTSTAEEPDVLAALGTLVDTADPAQITVARDLHTKIGLVACGLGIGTLPAGSAYLAPPGTRVVELDPVLPLPDLHLVFRTDDGSPAVAALLDTAAGLFPSVQAHLAWSRRG